MGSRVGFANARAETPLPACSLGSVLIPVPSVLPPGISEQIRLPGHHGWSELVNTTEQRRVHRRGGGFLGPKPECQRSSEAHCAGKVSGVSRTFLSWVQEESLTASEEEHGRVRAGLGG